MKRRRRVLFAVATASAVLAVFAVVARWAPALAPGVAIALCAGAVVYVALYAKDLLAHLALETQALHQIGHLPLTTAMPWSEYAIAPRVVARLLFEIESREAAIVAECGSGVSTLVIAQTLKSIGKGHLYSLEHDPHWASFVGRMLEANGLTPYATVVVASLKQVEVLGEQSRWYDEERVSAALGGAGPIDVLVVDGPPEASGRLPRMRALPFFAERLADEALLLVDDLHRAGEQRMLTRWSSHYELRAVDVSEEEGYGFFTVGRSERSSR